MSVTEVKKTEDIVNEMADKNQQVFARESSLAEAKAIQGLRAVFDEVKFKHYLLYINYETCAWMGDHPTLSQYATRELTRCVCVISL